jgi:phosphohistidine phosphatase
MKKIIFVRHARAEEASSEITDFERSLTIKGKTVSRHMARIFREKEKSPGLICTSPAFRAIETAFIFASEFDFNYDDIRIESSLYFKAGIKSLFNLLGKIDDKFDTVTLFGHNPAFTEMPDRLSANGCEFLTKTSVVCVAFKTDSWSGVKLDSGKIEYFLKPEK